jgi:tetratricopeptide (TPR) repeat protein
VLKRFLLFLPCILPVLTWGQNTIGGQKLIVAEAEVNRESEFVNAEKERLLAHYDKAIEGYKHFTYDNPDIDAAWFGLARSYGAKEDYQNGLECIGKAISKNPGNQWYREYQAVLYEKSGRTGEAAAVYDGLNKQFPKNPDYLRKLAYLAILSEDAKTSLKALDKLEALTGVTEETAGKKHVIYVKIGEAKKAAQELQKLVDAYPGRLEYRHKLAQFYDSVMDQAAAKKVYEDILRLKPDDPVAKMAVADKGKSGSGVAYLNGIKPLVANQQIPIDAKMKEILPYLSKISGPNQEPGLADALLDVCNLLEKTHPNDAKAVSLTAAVLYQTNRHAEALEKYKLCLKLNPNVFGAWDNTLAILQEQKKYDEMLRISEQAIDAFPNQPRAYYYYGVAATEKGKYDDALSQLDQAAIMAGNTPIGLDIMDQAGLTLLRKKDLPGATQRFEQALSKGGGKHPGILEHYGDALFQAGNKAAAISNWQKAYDLSKDPAILQKIKGS